MTNLITREELLKRLKERGYDITYYTIRYYGNLGLVPRSERVSRGEHKMGTVGMYRPETVDRVIRIKELQKEGKSLEEIASILKVSSGRKIASESLKIAKSEVEPILRNSQQRLKIIKRLLPDKDRNDKNFSLLFENIEAVEEDLQSIQNKLDGIGLNYNENYDGIVERIRETFAIFRREKK